MLDGDPGDPLEIEGGEPQLTAIRIKSTNINVDVINIHVYINFIIEYTSSTLFTVRK